MRQGSNSRRSRRGGTRRHQNQPLRNQTFDSNGPDIHIRGNAFQVHDKYLALARNASSIGDRIVAENYLQHADHYQRIIAQINEANNEANDDDMPVQEHNGHVVEEVTIPMKKNL